MTLHFITKDNLLKLISSISSKYRTFVPKKKGDILYYELFCEETAGDVVFGEVRATQPIKSFYTKAREVVALYSSQAVMKESGPIAIIGVKGCDLQSFAIQDYVYNEGDFKDPIYIGSREKNLVISCDCTTFLETCFCTALGNEPYPIKEFDLNLSKVEGGFLAETGSAKGEKLAKENSRLFQDASQAQKRDRDNLRKKVSSGVKTNCKEKGTPDAGSIKGSVKKSYESDLWKEHASTCIECGGCNLVCPTCHCFFLSDQKGDTGFAKYRTWDGCLYKSFARVAGDANPRKYISERLRNRFDKKFEFFPSVLGVNACTGCGRCIETCPGDIDIREVLKDTVK